ncbi:MAG TPA: L-histidine N(alpha)-methyltransferase [Acidimicrobiales bacterium]|nr:L-histidine N(alpha)-methyltransferase [Acidimicrobiales bacterium]
MVTASPALTIDVHLGTRDLRAALERDVKVGLGTAHKSLPPTWFYDEVGSKLFEEITELPEYYQTRAERALLTRNAAEIAARSRSDTLVELGAGSCDKTRLLLDALASEGELRRYVPFDVSAQFLRESASSIACDYAGLRVHVVVGDFLHHLHAVPDGGRRLIAFLGGTIGNLVPARRRRFLSSLRCTMEPSDHLLVGTDLVKDVPRIVAAYDDAAGVTARFNRNVLRVVNGELDADFVPARFEHVVRWDPLAQWIEMRLRSDRNQLVHIGALGLTVPFAQGEELLTEISAKFTPAGIGAELARAGFVVDDHWGGDGGEFLLTLAHPCPGR